MMTKVRPAHRGASRERNWRQRLVDHGKIWLLQHLQAALFSLGQLQKNLVGSLMTVAVIGIALAMPAGFYLLLHNAERVSDSWDTRVELALYLQLDTDNAAAETLAASLQADAEIDTVTYITPEAALTEFRAQSGFTESIDALEQNPLPAVLLVEPTETDRSAAAYDRLLNRLQSLPEVDRAVFDRQWLERLQAMIEVVQRAVLILSCVLGLGVLLIIGNTIRLGIYNRRAEIEINKLFGATDPFIQRPFMYTGFWYGLLGSLFAWLLVSAAFLFLRGPISGLASVYASDFRLAGVSFEQMLTLIGIGVILGLTGSWIAVQRHIRAIEPP
ncbi:MAG: permease-like cell division protein FtsX [Gammaproteobacteria bacterium]